MCGNIYTHLVVATPYLMKDSIVTGPEPLIDVAGSVSHEAG